MHDPDSNDEKKRQERNFREGVRDHNNEQQKIVGITSDGDPIKRDQPPGPGQSPSPEKSKVDRLTDDPALPD